MTCDRAGSDLHQAEGEGLDAYRYLTGEAEIGGGASLFPSSPSGAVGAAGRVFPFPPLGGGGAGRFSLRPT